MPYTKDPWIVSVIWGRLGAAILALLAFILGIVGYVFGPEDIEQAGGVITAILAGIGGMLALISKVRESKKADK